MIPKPKELTDAEAEAFLRYVFWSPRRKKTLVEALLETEKGKAIIEEWLKQRIKK